MANLDFLKFDPNKDTRKPFSMTDYEAIPPELRNDYVKTTSIPAKNQVSNEMVIEAPVAQKQVAIATPVEKPRIEEMKQIFSPQPEVPVEQPQFQPTSELVDPEEVKLKAQAMMPQSGPANWLPALAPLLAEAFMGGNGKSAGESLGISGNYLVDQEKDKIKRSQSLEDKLMEIQKARAIASAKAQGKNSLKTLEVDVNGKPIITAVPDAVGKQAWKAPTRESTALTFDQRLELEKQKAKLKKEMDGFKQKAKDSEKKIDLEKYYGSERSKDPFTRDTKKVADAYNKLSQLDPESKDPIQDIAVIFDFMKSLDPGSVVRESEQSLVMGAKSVGDFVENLSDMLKKNRKLTPDQVRGIQRFSALNYQRRLQSQETQVDARYKKIAEKYGLDPQVVLEDLSMGTPMLWTDKKTGRTKILSIPKGQEAEAEAAGAQRVK
jgi:Fe-S cluster biosynthesis and repair protein YggX